MCIERAVDIGIPEATRENSSDLRQIRDACLWFDFENPFPEPLSRGNTKSSLEEEIRNYMSRGGARILPGAACQNKRLGKRSDFTVQSKCGRAITVEADGWTHLIRQSNGNFGYDGHTFFQTALALKLDQNSPIVRIPNIAINAAKKAHGTVPSASMCGCFDDAATHRRNTGKAGCFTMIYNPASHTMALQQLVA